MATAANTSVNWLDVDSTAINQILLLNKTLEKIAYQNGNWRKDILKLFNTLCKTIMFFPVLTNKEYTILFPFINYTIYKIIKRVFDYKSSSLYVIVIQILTYIFNVCNFDLDGNFIETLIELNSSFDEKKYLDITDKITEWYDSNLQKEKRKIERTIQSYNNELKNLENEKKAYIENEPQGMSNQSRQRKVLTELIPEQQDKFKEKLKEKPEVQPEEIISIINNKSFINIPKLIIPHPTCIVTQDGNHKESPLSAKDYDNIFTMIYVKPETQACCNKYISQMLINDKQLAYGSKVNIPSSVEKTKTLQKEQIAREKRLTEREENLNNLLKNTNEELTRIWYRTTYPIEKKKELIAELLSSDTYIDDIFINSPEAFESKVNGMGPGSTVLGYTVEFKKDTSGKTSCRFIVPTGSNFKEISKMMLSKKMLSEPKFTYTSQTYLYKMNKLRQLIAAIDAERSLCTGTNSFFPTKVVSGFSSLSKWGRGGRKSRKLNKCKLNRKKTKRYRSKKQRKTHKRR